MKATQILYLLLFVGVIVCIVTSSHLLDLEGFQGSILPVNNISEPTIAKGVEPARLSIQAQPNSSAPGSLPFGPYGQMASVGSYQYQDPALLPAELNQMKQLKEDLRAFLVFEGPSVAGNSDPTVQLPLTQLRADSRKLDQEISVLSNNPGIQSSLTQQNIADIQGSLAFLQRKVRLFQTSGVVNTSADRKEGFQDGSDAEPKIKATKEDLQALQTKVYAAILTLSSSGTTDPTVQARIKILEELYSAITVIINNLDTGVWTSSDIDLYKEDIDNILPYLDDPSKDLENIFDQPSGIKLSPVEQQLASLVGEDNAKNVFNHLLDKGMFRVNVEMGYNLQGSKRRNHRLVPGTNRMVYENSYDLLPSSTDSSSNSVEPYSLEPGSSSGSAYGSGSAMSMEGPYDTRMPGAEQNNSKVGGLDWKNRTESICEQVRLRGLDPMDFGCIAKGSLMSPAYSWRGHAKMVCGRLNTTMDPNLPVVCGCPPQEWRGWNTF